MWTSLKSFTCAYWMQSSNSSAQQAGLQSAIHCLVTLQMRTGWPIIHRLSYVLRKLPVPSCYCHNSNEGAGFIGTHSRCRSNNHCLPVLPLFSAPADCLCPAGTAYSRDNNKGTGFKHVSCKPCAGKLEYMDLNMHARKDCKICPAGLVPNTERTECGKLQGTSCYVLACVVRLL